MANALLWTLWRQTMKCWQISTQHIVLLSAKLPTINMYRKLTVVYVVFDICMPADEWIWATDMLIAMLCIPQSWGSYSTMTNTFCSWAAEKILLEQSCWQQLMNSDYGQHLEFSIFFFLGVTYTTSLLRNYYRCKFAQSSVCLVLFIGAVWKKWYYDMFCLHTV